jgi:hypothetical protein
MSDADRTAGARRPDAANLAALNDEIKRLVAGRGTRAPEDLVPDVEAIMRRHGALEPSRDGMLQWIEQAMVEIRAAGPS